MIHNTHEQLLSPSYLVYLKNLIGNWAIAEQSHHALDALVSSLLIVIFRALDGVKQAITVIWDPLEHIVDPSRSQRKNNKQ